MGEGRVQTTRTGSPILDGGTPSQVTAPPIPIKGFTGCLRFCRLMGFFDSRRTLGLFLLFRLRDVKT